MRKNERGQTTVEYVLLLFVILGIIAAIYRHPLVKNFMSGGDVITQLGLYMQYSYRHALPGKKREKYRPTYDSIDHASYHSGSDTRFFGPKQGYP